MVTLLQKYVGRTAEFDIIVIALDVQHATALVEAEGHDVRFLRMREMGHKDADTFANWLHVGELAPTAYPSVWAAPEDRWGPVAHRMAAAGILTSVPLSLRHWPLTTLIPE